MKKYRLYILPIASVVLLIASHAATSGFLDSLKEAVAESTRCTVSPERYSQTKGGILSANSRLYRGPYTNCSSKGKSKGEIGTVIVGEKGNWYYVKVKDTSGRIIKGWAQKNRVSLLKGNIADQKKEKSTKVQRASSEPKKPAKPSQVYPREMVAEVQQLLNQRNYEAGVVDGLYGRGTKNAVMSFQRDAGLPATGKLDTNTVAALRDASGPYSTNNDDAESSQKNDELKKGSITLVELTDPIQKTTVEILQGDMSEAEYYASDNPSKYQAESPDKRKKIGDSEAVKLINYHIYKLYGNGVKVGRSYFNSQTMDKKLSKRNRANMQPYMDYGLAIYKESIKKDDSPIFAAMGKGKSYQENIVTQKGKKISIKDDKDKSIYYFNVGYRENIRIVSIGDDNTVLFAFEIVPNKLGQALGHKPTLRRGKAKIKYDPFLATYKFMGYWESKWEEEKWINNGGWTYNKSGEIVQKWGVIQ